jgi:transcriptional regulator with GAF, ATPase, and Fis domain
MQPLPSRVGLAALSEAANAVVPAPLSGFAWALEGNLVSILYSYPYGIGECRIPAAQLPRALHGTAGGPRDDECAALTAEPRTALDFMLAAENAARLVSLPLGGEADGRFWVAVADARPLTNEQLDRLAVVAADAARLVTTAPSREQIHQRFARLELAAELVPSLLHVLDIREVFERLSVAAKRALPHDLLLLRIFSEDFTTITVYARSDRGAAPPMVVPNTYPRAVSQAWTFDIIDDFSLHPMEKDAPPAKLGARSVVRVPIRFDDRLIGGLGFLSFTPSRFISEDVEVARRLADHVAVALSHYELANRLAEEARRAEGLRVRTMNLELLDELLTTLGDADALSDVFGRISAIAGKVLPHDATAMLVRLPGGRRARVYAGPGYPSGGSETIEIPEDMLEAPDWEHHIKEHGSGVEGFPSLLRVPIRFEGRLAGALIFLSHTASAFTQADVLVARRLADRLAITLAHDREVEAVKRADEATARAAKLEARVRMLTDELDARTGYRRVIGESKPWRQVLTQAAQVAATETAALPEQLLEAELFGYERGAYTGATQTKPGQLEQAAGGTLFLDEVGEMSPSAQAKFLRVLQEREFQRLGGTRVLRTDARIVAATNRDLPRAIANGQFREDLYYRLNVFAIHLPALRERRDDVLPLSQAFIAEIGRSLGRPPAGIARDARQMLVDYHWPGNVRELRNILERAAILCDGGLITSDHLALGPPAGAAQPSAAPSVRAEAERALTNPSPAAASAAGDLHSMERAMIEQALQSARFNKSKAAQTLGITRHQLYIRMRKYGLE